MTWKIYYYSADESGTRLQDEFNAKSAEYRAEFDVAVRYLVAQPRDGWRRPRAAKLKAPTDIFEIRFKADRVQRRPLGFFGPGPDQFTIVLLADEKGNAFVPKDAVEIASRKIKEILEGKAHAKRMVIPGLQDEEPGRKGLPLGLGEGQRQEQPCLPNPGNPQ